MDEYALGRDIGSLEARVKALEQALAALKGGNCGCGNTTHKGATVQMLGMAEKTDKPADPSITTRPDTGPGSEIRAECSDGHLRRITYNGVCYCQMCCGGKWVYFCYQDGTCVQCPGGITVNCAGNNWILSC